MIEVLVRSSKRNPGPARSCRRRQDRHRRGPRPADRRRPRPGAAARRPHHRGAARLADGRHAVPRPARGARRRARVRGEPARHHPVLRRDPPPGRSRPDRGRDGRRPDPQAGPVTRRHRGHRGDDARGVPDDDRPRRGARAPVHDRRRPRARPRRVAADPAQRPRRAGQEPRRDRLETTRSTSCSTSPTARSRTRRFPDKAIDLLEQAIAHAIVAGRDDRGPRRRRRDDRPLVRPRLVDPDPRAVRARPGRSRPGGQARARSSAASASSTRSSRSSSGGPSGTRSCSGRPVRARPRSSRAWPSGSRPAPSRRACATSASSTCRSCRWPRGSRPSRRCSATSWSRSAIRRSSSSSTRSTCWPSPTVRDLAESLKPALARGDTDRLPLARALDHRRLSLPAPGLAVHGISTEPRLVPEIHLATGCFGLSGNGREPFASPLFDRFRIALVRPLQRFLRRQSQLGQQCSHRRYAKPDMELSLDQFSHQRPRPQPEIQAILTWIATVDPTKHLLLLARRQTAWPPRRRPRTQRTQSHTWLRCRFQPSVDRRAVESERGNDG